MSVRQEGVLTPLRSGLRVGVTVALCSSSPIACRVGPVEPGEAERVENAEGGGADERWK